MDYGKIAISKNPKKFQGFQGIFLRVGKFKSFSKVSSFCGHPAPTILDIIVWYFVTSLKSFDLPQVLKRKK